MARAPRHIRPDEVRDLFPERIWMRARDLHAERRVVDLEWAPDDGEWQASVMGRGGVYHVWVAPELDPSDPRLNAQCSCPADKPCKHIGAVVLAIGGDADAEARLPVADPFASSIPAIERPNAAVLFDEWAARVEDAEQDADAGAPGARELRYVLQIPTPTGNRARAGMIEVSLHEVERREDGERVVRRRAVSGPHPDWFGTRDLDLIAGLELAARGSAHGATPGWLPPTGRAAEVLRALIGTGRCHLGRPTGVKLEIGPDRPGALVWRAGPDGYQRVAFTADDDGAKEDALLLPVAPPWICDPDTGVCNPLTLQIPPQVAAALLEMPPLSPEQSNDLPPAVGRVLARWACPPPTPIPIEERQADVVTPVLDLEPMGEGGELAVARLSFSHDGVIVPAGVSGPVVQAMVGGELHRLRRDVVAEARAVRALRQLGLTHGWVGGTFLLDGENAWIDLCATGVPLLESEGWTVRLHPDFPFRAARPSGWYMETDASSSGDWFSLELGVTVDGRRINILPLVVRAIRSSALDLDALRDPEGPPVALRLDDGRLLSLPRERLGQVLQVLVELHGDRPLKDGRLQLGMADAARVTELETEDLEWADGRLQDLARTLRAGPVQLALAPAGLHARLRGYQHQGVAWLGWLARHGLGGVLADDMGLGKTVQTLAHLQAEKEAGHLDRPVLVVAPRSVLRNWEREAVRFTPDLRTAVYHGAGREEILSRLGELDLVITTYALLTRDEPLRAEPWRVVVLDEAQAIKNDRTKVTRAARELQAHQRLALTGTPMENHLGELWSLMTFVMPGLLGTREAFGKLYRRPIERDGDVGRLRALGSRLGPFILRRTKDQVLTELPPKTETVLYATLEGKQQDLYETVRLTMEKRVRDALQAQGLARSQIVVLDALLKLRQVCCSPDLLDVPGADRAGVGAKMDLLRELVEELLGAGRRILLFSQFTSMFDRIEPMLDDLGARHLKITGQTRERQDVVDRFQAGEVPVLLVSLKAGGTGLNLTAADVVIHYDPWWNPAAEDQATDRAHRIGQDKPVTVYRLICEGTVEERMLALQARKRGLTTALQSQAEGRSAGGFKLREEDLDALLAPLGD